ncbi:MAG: c-type cytochrome, partial [Bacteroidota bacterium]|nr:c-type cytochrome [Bacteroidota bacterium]
MQKWKHRKILFLLAAVILIAGSAFIISSHNSQIDFNTQVKPLLNKNCITCHGGVRQQANFSLLFRSEALKKTKSGKYAIIPGDAAGSEMIRRIKLNDPEDRMPYKHPPLTQDDIEVLTKWINQGAKWGNHWAYIAVKKEEVPMPESSFFGLIPAE